jgi:adenosylhomocysteine nucleosidase
MRRAAALLFSLLTIVTPARAADVARTAVMSAFGPELEDLKARTQDRRAHMIDGVEFTTGTLEGKPVVLFLSGVSMVNAARSTQLALDRFHVRRIVFSGVGGGVDPALGVGDVVVPEQWAEYLEMTFARQTADGYVAPGGPPGPPNFGMMYPTPVNVTRPSGGPELKTWFPVDPELLAAARRSVADTPLKQCLGDRCLPKPPRIVVGGNGVSGAAFVDNAAFRQYAFSAFRAEVLDMESAAVAQVAYENRTPFIVFRSLSDLAGGDPGENEFPKFVGLAADNSAAAVERFLKALP